MDTKSPTPILDRVEPLPAPIGMSITRVWIELACSVALVAPFFWRLPFMKAFLRWGAKNIILTMSDPDWAGVRVILTGFAIALMCMCAIAIHECGHVLVGLAFGFRCEGIRVGRFRIDRGLRLSRHRDSGDPALGWALIIPQQWDKIGLRLALMRLAGPMANFVSGYAVFRLLHEKTLISGSFVAVSFLFGVVNLLPSGMSGQLTDGARIWTAIFNPARAQRDLANLKLKYDLDRGVPMEALSSADLEAATALLDKSADTVLAHAIAFLSAYAQHDDAKAEQLLETALRYSAYAGPSARERLALHAAMFQARRRGRIDLAKQWMADVPDTSPFLEARSKIAAAIRATETTQQSREITQP